MQIATAMESYTQKDAIDESQLLKVDEYCGVPVFASLACYFVAALHRPIERLKVVHAALKALQRPREKNGQRVVRGTAEDDYEQLLVVQNDNCIALLFPEDF